MRTIITGGTIINCGKRYSGTVIIDDEVISKIECIRADEKSEFVHADRIIDAKGCIVMPGVIDSHVHFREPGLTEKADIESESKAAVAGGVTTFFDMPNTIPQTTTLEALTEKHALAARKSHINYSFFFGATNGNAPLFDLLDVHAVPGIKLFMGSSTGNMLVDKRTALEQIFRSAPLPIMAHCEDSAIINENMRRITGTAPQTIPISMHPLIRSSRACYESTALAIELAKKYGTRLHVAHISTARELDLFSPTPTSPISAEAVVGHLLFCDDDYATLGARIKVNPAIKTADDQNALRRAIADGRIRTVATDHAPHLLEQKAGDCKSAASGMPMVQFALPAMLALADEGVVTVERIVELMCHAPAELFSVRERGFLKAGYKADITIVRAASPWTVTTSSVLSKCGWSPVEGRTFNWRVVYTLCNGHIVYDNGVVDSSYIGQPVVFR